MFVFSYNLLQNISTFKTSPENLSFRSRPLVCARCVLAGQHSQNFQASFQLPVFVRDGARFQPTQKQSSTHVASPAKSATSSSRRCKLTKVIGSFGEMLHVDVILSNVQVWCTHTYTSGPESRAGVPFSAKENMGIALQRPQWMH